MIKKQGSQWVVTSSTGKVLGKYKTKKEAMDQIGKVYIVILGGKAKMVIGVYSSLSLAKQCKFGSKKDRLVSWIETWGIDGCLRGSIAYKDLDGQEAIEDVKNGE